MLNVNAELLLINALQAYSYFLNVSKCFNKWTIILTGYQRKCKNAIFSVFSYIVFM